MDFGSLLKDLLIITLPAAAVLYGMFLVVKSFLSREINESLLQLKAKQNETVLPMRLQAYERMAIFLERNAINSLLPRLTESGQSAAELHQLLLYSIREEFNHNISQQIYMSQDAWDFIKSAVEENISMINQAFRELQEKENPSSFELSRKLFELQAQKEFSQSEASLQFIKSEIQQLF